MLRFALARGWFASFLMLGGLFASTGLAADPALTLQRGDHVLLIGNTLAERMQYFGHFETLLHSRFPDLELYVRNLGWSADELTLRPRSRDFQDHGHSLADHRADVVLAFFGFNESFAGPEGLPKFEADLEQFITETLQARYNGRSAPRLALVSPIAHENLRRRELPDGSKNNANLALYTEAMRKLAAKHGVAFVDLYQPTSQAMPKAPRPFTINGVHLNEQGDREVARLLDQGLFGPRPSPNERADYEQLRAEVNEKNLQFFYDHRAVNGFYIYGGRKNPFGTVNFPAEFKKLRAMTAVRDRRVWDVAQGKNIAPTIDDSGTGAFVNIETNKKDPAPLTNPEESRRQMVLSEGYEVNLFASEVEFPELENPVQFAFDNRGRLWVCTMASYPQYLPGVPVNDKVLILEDTNGDGKADKKTVFADKLHIPTGIALADGGAYVAQQPNLVFLRDTDGDDVADERTIVLHGFDSADSHHSISAFTFDQGGSLYFEEGTFHHSQIETPYGPRRLKDAGVFRWEPRTGRFEIFVSYGFANPWGHVVDRWGQNLIADASGGANYYGTAFSGDVDYPTKHQSMRQFLVKQWRPTAGCELVTSRNFPDAAQGNFLLNNCIGFQGVLQYKMRDEGSGFAADPVEPLLQSSDPNFRPVDIEFGPDGALYLCDWFNPLVGHMQHNLRDPNRDHAHGRIWRVHYKNRPLVKPTMIAGQPIAALLDVLSTIPEERTRERARLELRSRDTEQVLREIERWLARQNPQDPEFEHHWLEALWQHQQHDVVDEGLLDRMLGSPDPRARAAATRVLCCWRERVGRPIERLQKQIHDEHPRVRLEAVRALSFFRDSQSLAAALELLEHPLDYYLGYTLRETVATLDKRVRQWPGAPAAPTAQLLAQRLDSGRLSSDGIPVAAELICQYGRGEDLAYVLNQVIESNRYDVALKINVLNALVEAATTRKVRPTGKLDALEQLLAAPAAEQDPGLRKAVIRLASLWKVGAVNQSLQDVLHNPQADGEAQKAAIDGLAALNDSTSRAILLELSTREAPSMRVRLLAVAALVRLDPAGSPARAAGALSEASPNDDLGGVLDAFFNRREGTDQLAAALEKRGLNPDTAKMALRHLYSVGRSDKNLSDVLSRQAGISAEMKLPTPAEVAEIVADVAARGDAVRGEQIFRRADLSCLKCHAVSKAGGQVGPDLSAVGSISPIDYIVNSILDPNLAVKEQFVTRVVVTSNGETFTGVVVDRNDVRLNLRDAAGKLITIPVADIDDEAEGRSLMPQGLTKFLTRDELIDLARFISELGKPGPYAIRTIPSIQRWRVLRKVPANLPKGVPSGDELQKLVLSAKGDAWAPAYATVGGDLPLADVTSESGPIFLQGEINVTEAGTVLLRTGGAVGYQVWVDSQLVNVPEAEVKLTPGVHKVTLRVQVGKEPKGSVRVDLLKPAGSTAQFDVIGGA